ncbi:putative aminoadipate reductase [Mycena latifolia]|nr:putative aminoadipate reductase [Mycena latifolia]
MLSLNAPLSASMLLPDVITLNSESRPADPFYIYAKPDPSSEIVTITHLEFGRATHRAAQILRPNGEGSDGRVVSLLALSDTVLYKTLMTGLMTANFVPFPISPRNSISGIFHLLRNSSCHHIIATCVTLEPLLAGLKRHIAEVDPDYILNIEEVPSLAQIYPNLGGETVDCAFQPYSAQLSRRSLDDIGLYLHSSGSTGLPKAIAQTHRTLIQLLALPCVAETRDYMHRPIGNMALPAFHMLGLVCQLLQPLAGICVALYPPTAKSPSALPIMPSPDNILENARKTRCKSLTVVPALLVYWAKFPAVLTYLKTLHTILWGGGPLPRKIGDALVKEGLNLRLGYGTTETAAISTVIPYEDGDEKEWEWFRFGDSVKVRWVPQGDDIFECQVLTWENHAPTAENLDDVRGYATSDLFVNHPTRKHLWKLVGRLDDVIVHSSGEKTVPAPMEDIIMSSPYVTATVMFGSARGQAGILIELAPDLQDGPQGTTQLAELRNKVWPIIEEANEIAPAFSRIFKEMILFTSPNKPLPRTGKGTVMRNAAVNMYFEEIESIYTAVAETTGVGSIKPPTVWESAHIQEWLLQLAGNLCHTAQISPAVDVFQQGFDSLTATIFRLHIMRALRSLNDAAVAQRAVDNIAHNLVYSHPTISQLSTYLDALARGAVADPVNAEVLMDKMIADYISGLPRVPGSATTVGVGSAVLLTGSTGNLGSQILASLLNDDIVLKVYALNRPSTSPTGPTLAERHLKVFNDRGLDAALLRSSKLVFVEGRTAEENLGLSVDLYDEIRNSVTLIIHNAWTLDFNMHLASFEPHIQGTRHLVDLALSSPRAPRFLFTSSIASAQSWDHTRGPCPEEIFTDPTVAMGGYGQSKYVAEQILAKSGLNASCLRIGQVCGALPKGAWATSDWVPILVKTSMTLGCLPRADGLVSWIDFETAAQAIMDVAFINTHNLERLPIVLNLVHPRPVPWNFVMACIREVFLKNEHGSTNLPLVEFPDWYNKLESFGARGDYAKETLPGLRLLDFFRTFSTTAGRSADSEFGGVAFSVNRIQTISSAVKSASGITKEHVEAWMNYWNGAGFV